MEKIFELIKNISANDVIVIGGHNSMTTSTNPILGNNQFMSITQQLQACRGMSACLLDIDNAHNNKLLQVSNKLQATYNIIKDPYNPTARNKLQKTINKPDILTSRHGAMPINFSDASTSEIYREIWEFHKSNPTVRIDIRVENNNIGPTDIVNVLSTVLAS